MGEENTLPVAATTAEAAWNVHILAVVVVVAVVIIVAVVFVMVVDGRHVGTLPGAIAARRVGRSRLSVRGGMECVYVHGITQQKQQERQGQGQVWKKSWPGREAGKVKGDRGVQCSACWGESVSASGASASAGNGRGSGPPSGRSAAGTGQTVPD